MPQVVHAWKNPYLGGMALFDEASTALGTGMNIASAVNPVVAGIGAIPEAFKLGLGVTQALRARKIEKSQQRPIFGIPGAAQNALAGQYNLAMGQAPGLNTAQQQLAQARAGSVSAVQNSGGGGAERLAALTMLDQNAGNQARELGAMQEQWQAQQQANLINAQNQYADWQQRAWEYNKYKPYEQAMAKAAELRNAANTNFYGAAKSAGGLISSALSGGGQKTLGDLAKDASIPGRQMESPYNSQNKVIDQRNMGPQGEGPINPNGMDKLAPIPASGDGSIPFMGSTAPNSREYNPDGMPVLGFNYAMGNNLGSGQWQRKFPISASIYAK